MKYKAFKQKLSIALAAMMIMASASTVSFAAGFSDLSQASWAKATIEEWTQKGLVSGYPDGTFRPSNHITRAEFATLVQKAFDLKSEAKSEFSDVKSSDWYYDAVATLASLGVVGGYEDGTFRPAGHITRAEAAAIMTNLKKLNPNASAAEKFADYASMADWAKGHVGAVVEAKFMSGYPDGTFKASNTITRAESVATLNNVINPGEAKANLVIDKAGTYGGTEVDYQMVKGNVTVNVADVTLKNMVIDGDLILAEGIGEGEVTLENVTVKGDTHVLGGGANSIYIKNSKMAKIFVNKKNGQIRIVAQGTSTFGTITAQSGVKLEEQNLINSEGFAEIVIDENAKGEIVLEGKFSKVTVKAEGITLRIPEGSSVGELKIEKKISVVGTGTIEKAIIYVNGVTFEKAPVKIESGTKSPITIVVGGTEQTVTPPSTGGGGGGGGGSTTPVEFSSVFSKKELAFDDFSGTYHILMGENKINARARYIIKAKSEVAPTEEQILSLGDDNILTKGNNFAIFDIDEPKGDYVLYLLAYDLNGVAGTKDKLVTFDFTIDKYTASQYDYLLKAEYYRNGVLTENAMKEYATNEDVTADLVFAFYDENKDVLESKLSGADGLITRALSLESDNGTVYSQAIAQAILNYSGTLNVVDKTADAALLNSLAAGGSVSDVQALAEKFAASTLSEIESDIVALYGTKTISDVNKSGLVFRVTDGDSLADVAGSTTIDNLKNTLLSNAETLYFHSGSDVLELSIGNTKILIKVAKELKN